MCEFKFNLQAILVSAFTGVHMFKNANHVCANVENTFYFDLPIGAIRVLGFVFTLELRYKSKMIHTITRPGFNSKY